MFRLDLYFILKKPEWKPPYKTASAVYSKFTNWLRVCLRWYTHHAKPRRGDSHATLHSLVTTVILFCFVFPTATAVAVAAAAASAM